MAPVVESEAVKLLNLVRRLGAHTLSGHPTADITSLSYDSRLTAPGALFFCVPGLKRDGHEFAGDAVARGAVALCVQRPLDVAVPQVVVADVRAAMAVLARYFYGDPSRQLRVAGVTGTNGKTTTAYLTAWLLEHAEIQTGLLGTVERIIGGRHLPAERTTPEALDLQQDLAAMVAEGDRATVMEVSSHALELGRVDGILFRVVAFTNLTQDHLDFHGSFEAYRRAKLRLFADDVFSCHTPPAVINLDDPMGGEIARQIASDRLLTFAVEHGHAEPGVADLELTGLNLTAGGIDGTLMVRGRALRGQVGVLEMPLAVPLLGRFNASNVLTALGMGLGLGLTLEDMLEAVRHFPGVPGRMQQVDAGQPFTVLVDYAHTPDSVENVLRTARAVTTGRVIALLGCGGDRDRTKRPKMGRALADGCDVPIVTSDNPRTEDPRAIIEEILGGLSCPEEALVEVDRRQAIKKAISCAEAGDLVLILGKGHESGQEIADRKIPFNDFQVALSLLHERGWGRG